MKLFARTLVVLVACAGIVVSASAQGLVFTARPSTTLQSASLGVSTGPFMPYIGLDVIGVSASITEEEYEVDFGDDYFSESRETNELKGSALLLIPHIGVRFALGSSKSSVRPYVFADFCKSLAFASAEGKEVYSYTYQSPWGDESGHEVDEIDDDEATDVIEDVLGFYGLTLGFGGEYFFSEKFSLGAEFGFRYLGTSAEYEGSDSDSGPYGSEWREKWKTEGSAALKLTHTALCLNFYFD